MEELKKELIENKIDFEEYGHALFLNNLSIEITKASQFYRIINSKYYVELEQVKFFTTIEEVLNYLRTEQ